MVHNVVYFCASHNSLEMITEFHFVDICVVWPYSAKSNCLYSYLYLRAMKIVQVAQALDTHM